MRQFNDKPTFEEQNCNSLDSGSEKPEIKKAAKAQQPNDELIPDICIERVESNVVTDDFETIELDENEKLPSISQRLNTANLKQTFLWKNCTFSNDRAFCFIEKRYDYPLENPPGKEYSAIMNYDRYPKLHIAIGGYKENYYMAFELLCELFIREPKLHKMKAVNYNHISQLMECPDQKGKCFTIYLGAITLASACKLIAMIELSLLESNIPEPADAEKVSLKTERQEEVSVGSTAFVTLAPARDRKPSQGGMTLFSGMQVLDVLDASLSTVSSEQSTLLSAYSSFRLM